jgi:hypothetical protein
MLKPKIGGFKMQIARQRGQGTMKQLATIAGWLILVGLTSAAAGEAKTHPNAPKELIGKYGNSPAQCRSYHRKSDNLTSIDATSYEFCGGSGCGAIIVSHQKLTDGYILYLKSGGNPSGWRERVRVLDRTVIEITPLTEPARHETLVRCTKADAIAGIGLAADNEHGLTKSLDGVFAAYYALAVPNKCDGIEVNTKAAETIVEAGRLLWTEFLLNGPNARFATPQGIAETIAGEKRSAEYALRADAAEITEFCSEVLNAFGNGGRILPNLLKDPRRKV